MGAEVQVEEAKLADTRVGKDLEGFVLLPIHGNWARQPA